MQVPGHAQPAGDSDMADGVVDEQRLAGGDAEPGQREPVDPRLRLGHPYRTGQHQLVDGLIQAMALDPVAGGGPGVADNRRADHATRRSETIQQWPVPRLPGIHFRPQLPDLVRTHSPT